MMGLLVQQLWGRRTVVDLGQPVPIVTEEIETGAHPLIINPFINFQLGKGWYIGTNDLVAQYSWEFGGAAVFPGWCGRLAVQQLKRPRDSDSGGRSPKGGRPLRIVRGYHGPSTRIPTFPLSDNGPK